MRRTRVPFAIVALCVGLTGCSAKRLEQQGARVHISYEKPDGNCRKVTDIIGAQGNWFTGGYPSNKNLLEGAMNDLRNQAGSMGGTHVWVHQQQTNTGVLGDTVNAVAVGTVYKCD